MTHVVRHEPMGEALHFCTGSALLVTVCGAIIAEWLEVSVLRNPNSNRLQVWNLASRSFPKRPRRYWHGLREVLLLYRNR